MVSACSPSLLWVQVQCRSRERGRCAHTQVRKSSAWPGHCHCGCICVACHFGSRGQLTTQGRGGGWNLITFWISNPIWVTCLEPQGLGNPHHTWASRGSAPRGAWLLGNVPHLPFLGLHTAVTILHQTSEYEGVRGTGHAGAHSPSDVGRERGGGFRQEQEERASSPDLVSEAGPLVMCLVEETVLPPRASRCLVSCLIDIRA